MQRAAGTIPMIGPYALNTVVEGDCLELIQKLPDESVDIAVTSPPYWGQRTSAGTGVEEDPRSYVRALTDVFTALLPKLKREGLVWINLGDAYNTPVNWRLEDQAYSSLGPDGAGLNPENSAYTKPRAKRKAYIDKEVSWLTYGNLLALPYRLVLALCDAGYLSRGEVIWRKRNPCRRGGVAGRIASTNPFISSSGRKTIRSVSRRRSEACGSSGMRRSMVLPIPRVSPRNCLVVASRLTGRAGRT